MTIFYHAITHNPCGTAGEVRPHVLADLLRA